MSHPKSQGQIPRPQNPHPNKKMNFRKGKLAWKQQEACVKGKNANNLRIEQNAKSLNLGKFPLIELKNEW